VREHVLDHHRVRAGQRHAVAELGVDPAQEGKDLRRGRRVELAGRLVGEDDLGVVGERDGNRDALRLSGLAPSGIFLGKVAAVGAQLVALEVLLAVGVVVLYDVTLRGVVLLVATCVVATVGIAAAGTVYGVLAAGLRVRETLLPLLLLPVLAPVLLGAARASEAAIGLGLDSGWRWVQLLAVFALVYVVFGVVAFGPLLEET
jgi:heme exporter protein B